MADRAELETILSVQADRVLAGLDSFERSLNRIEKAHVTTGQAAEEHGKKVDGFIDKMTRLADVGKLFAAWEVIQRVMGAFSGLETFNVDLLRTTEIMGGNAQAASTWVVIAHEMGISVDQVDKAFTKLSTDMNAGANPALKQMGIAAEDTRGKLRPLNDVLGDAADYFQRHAGAVNNAALANELFGKSGFMLLPALEQGRSGIAAITEEARKYGLILDAETIQRNAAFTFQVKESQLALEGLAVSAGNAALPALAALGQAFSRVISDNLPAFISGINRAASYVIGFVEGLTGMELKVNEGAVALSSLSSIAGDTGTGLDNTAGAAQALAAAEQRVRDHAKDATAALDDQVRALNAQTEAMRFADQQQKLQEQLANKTQDIQALERDRYQQYWLGNFQTAADIGVKITRAQQEQEDLRSQLTRGTEDQQTKLKIASLEDQKRLIQKAADDQIEAMQRAAQKTTSDLTAAAAKFAPLFGHAGKDAGDRFKFAMDSAADQTGKSMAGKLLDALFGPETTVMFEGHGTTQIEKTFRQGGGDWLKIGQAIGNSIGTGIGTSLGDGLTKAIKGQIHQFGKSVYDLGALESQVGLPGGALTVLGGKLQQFHRGGIVQGASGSNQVIMAQAGERVVSANDNDGLLAILQEQNGILRAMLGALSGGGRPASMDSSLYNAIANAKSYRARIGAGA